ncbi:MAG TPA: hypothetical protein VKE69_13060, partial [Planctomycetota bacterium]|nr:hypothetical protein [Planctomycetota bacterium]
MPRLSSLMAAASLALAATGCFGGRSYLVGFPKIEGKDPSETADLMQRAVRKSEERMLELARGEESGEPWPVWERQGALKVVDTYVALGTDEIAPQTGLEPQGTRSRRKPLFLYPRATSPALVEATRVSDDPADERREWVIPVLLHRNALERPARESWLLGDPLSRLLLGHPGHDIPIYGEELIRGMAEKLHVMLVARDRRYPAALSPVRDPRRDVRVPGTEKRQQEWEVGAGGDRMHPRADALEFLFRVPTGEIEARWEEILAAEPGSERRRGELFDLRFFPRIAVAPGDAGEPWRSVLDALAEGRWPVARQKLADLVQRLADSGGAPADVGLTPASARSLQKALESRADDFHYFRPELQPVARHARRLADVLERPGDRPVIPIARDVLAAIAGLAEENPCPAPVFLDDPRPDDPSFSFLVGADLQYDTDGSNLFNFLTMFDPAVTPFTSSAAAEVAKLPEGIRKEVFRAKFALIVGDFGDGKGLSSSGFVAVADALGLTNPASPYADHWDPTHGEFPELRSQIGRSSKPIFAVPGNHDGFVAYGGLLNELVAGVGYGLDCIPIVSPIGRFLENESGDLPTIIRFVRLTPPFYDGLVDWVYELGPRNVAFNYRGCTFVAANSFDLHQVERDQVGALGNNWGGGLQDATLVWVDVALRHFSSLNRGARGLDDPPAKGNAFLFMHHDPRG